jgi:predicted nucleic acid-binding protein
MIFADLAAGSPVFLDANTLVYYFTADPVFGPSCNRLVQQIHQQQLLGSTSTHVLSEVAHRLMTIEAIKAFGWPAAGIARRLRQHPALVQQLVVFRQALEEVPRLNIQILTIPPGLLTTAAAISQQTGLLSNDAMIVAVMQANGLINLASSDADFDRVPGLTRYAPV